MIDSEENYKVTERAPCTGTIKAPLGQRGKDQVCTKQGVAVGSYQVQQPALSIGGLSGDKMVTVTGVFVLKRVQVYKRQADIFPNK